jgi:adenosylcobinamide kinase/adenosylcobinamide-phosphate guanylyltransferase
LSNLLFAGDAARQVAPAKRFLPAFGWRHAALVETAAGLPGQIILVSNEVGWGVVPMAALSRLFADEQGRLNQRVATVCERVTLVVPACR